MGVSRFILAKSPVRAAPPLVATDGLRWTHSAKLRWAPFVAAAKVEKWKKSGKKSGKVEIDLPASPKSAGPRTYSIAAAEP